jgi:hypothetical protein
LITKPTAVQSEVEGHETPLRLSTPEGTLCVAQVVPPSVVAVMAPVGGELVVSPTVVQSEVEGHETPLRRATPLGAVWVVQVAPPSVVAAMAPVDEFV